MKENLEQNVMDYLVSCMEKGEYAQLGAVRCARALGLSRVDVSACMNQMNEKKKLLRILSRPYLYLPVFWLEEHGLNPEKKRLRIVSAAGSRMERQKKHRISRRSL